MRNWWRREWPGVVLVGGLIAFIFLAGFGLAAMASAEQPPAAPAKPAAQTITVDLTDQSLEARRARVLQALERERLDVSATVVEWRTSTGPRAGAVPVVAVELVDKASK